MARRMSRIVPLCSPSRRATCQPPHARSKPGRRSVARAAARAMTGRSRRQRTASPPMTKTGAAIVSGSTVAPADVAAEAAVALAPAYRRSWNTPRTPRRTRTTSTAEPVSAVTPAGMRDRRPGADGARPTRTVVAPITTTASTAITASGPQSAPEAAISVQLRPDTWIWDDAPIQCANNGAARAAPRAPTRTSSAASAVAKRPNWAPLAPRVRMRVISALRIEASRPAATMRAAPPSRMSRRVGVRRATRTRCVASVARSKSGPTRS